MSRRPSPPGEEGDVEAGNVGISRDGTCDAGGKQRPCFFSADVGGIIRDGSRYAGGKQRACFVNAGARGGGRGGQGMPDLFEDQSSATPKGVSWS